MIFLLCATLEEKSLVLIKVYLTNYLQSTLDIIYDPDEVNEIDDDKVLKIKNKKIILNCETEYESLLNHFYKFKSKGDVELFLKPNMDLKPLCTLK